MPGVNAANVCVIPKVVLKYNLQCEDIERGFFSELTKSQSVEPSRIILVTLGKMSERILLEYHNIVKATIQWEDGGVGGGAANNLHELLVKINLISDIHSPHNRVHYVSVVYKCCYSNWTDGQEVNRLLYVGTSWHASSRIVELFLQSFLLNRFTECVQLHRLGVLRSVTGDSIPDVSDTFSRILWVGVPITQLSWILFVYKL